MRAYQLLEARAAAGETDWTILSFRQPWPCRRCLSLTDPPSPEAAAALSTAIWAYRRLETPIGVSGAGADAIAARLREAGVDVRVVAPSSGPIRLDLACTRGLTDDAAGARLRPAW